MVKKVEEQNYIIKSNEITKAIRGPEATIMTSRLFAFGISKLSNREFKIKGSYIQYYVSLKDFAEYYSFP